MEYIVKYTGNIRALEYPMEILDAQFAIFELGEQPPEPLLDYQQVTCYEAARHVSSLDRKSVV